MPPTTEATIAAQTQQVLDWLAEGKTNIEIAGILNLPVKVVATRVREVVAEARADARAHVQKRFTQHDERLEFLYKCCLKRINAMNLRQNANPNNEWGFDEKAVRAAVCVLERQARLLGIDKNVSVGGPNFNGWLDNQSGADLERLALSYGIDLPKPFDTSSTPTPRIPETGGNSGVSGSTPGLPLSKR